MTPAFLLADNGFEAQKRTNGYQPVPLLRCPPNQE
jgi:hypothetical protein